MGIGNITGGGTNGLYSVTMDYGVASRTKTVNHAISLINDLSTKKAAAQTEYETEAAKLAPLQAALNAAIEAMKVNLIESPTKPDQALIEAVNDAFKAIMPVRSEVELKKKVVDRYGLQLVEMQKLKAYYEGLVLTETKSLWCVDFTEDGSGQVATIEVPGEPAYQMIVPGCRAATVNDGRLYAREMMTGPQAFFNAAILPGVQKWKPTYRKGTLVALNKDANTGSVALDDVTSSALKKNSAQYFQVNQSDYLNNVPITYMSCHAEIFSVGDRVVVQFEGMDWAAPKIIGFVDHPKPCIRYTLHYTSEWGGAISGNTTQSVIKGRDGTEVSWYQVSPYVGFKRWKDNGSTNPVRRDLDVQADINAEAEVEVIWTVYPPDIKYIGFNAVNPMDDPANFHLEASGGDPAVWTSHSEPGWSVTINGVVYTCFSNYELIASPWSVTYPVSGSYSQQWWDEALANVTALIMTLSYYRGSESTPYRVEVFNYTAVGKHTGTSSPITQIEYSIDGF